MGIVLIYSSLRVLSEIYPMNTNMTGFRWFSETFASLCLDESSLPIAHGSHTSHSFDGIFELIAIFGKIFEKGMLIRTQQTDFLQIVISFKDIVQNIIDPDTNF